MAIELKMPALSPTMEEGTLARWLKSEGDEIAPGDIIAEIETDKATMEFEAIDEGTLTKIMVPEGTENVAVGTIIAMMAGEGEEAGEAASTPAPTPASIRAQATPSTTTRVTVGACTSTVRRSRRPILARLRSRACSPTPAITCACTCGARRSQGPTP